LERANKTLSNLAEDQLLKEVAPGRNRLIYLWGHLTAVHDARFPILGLEDRLSEKIEVLSAIAAGNANRLIADRLSITEETVKGHGKNILSKLGANDRTHAVTIGLKRGIIEL
jgi:DNA-binding NarL/FixJ family response regulator